MAHTRIRTDRGWRKTSRRCASLLKIRKRKCPRCYSRYQPQRQWQKFCSRNCRWALHDVQRKKKIPKRILIGSVGKPFGSIRCPVCETSFASTRSSKKYCSHKCYRTRMSRNWMSKNRARGMCYDCENPPISGTVSRCEKHWLMQLAWRSGLRAKVAWSLLKKKFVQQKGRCSYTKKRLLFGRNASLDHIRPRALFPNLVGVVSNLEWVDTDVNRAKRTLSRFRFIKLCELVVRHARRP